LWAKGRARPVERRQRMSSKKPAEKTGSSTRGPKELDQAKKNRGLPDDVLTLDDDDPRGLASGRTEEEEERATDKDEK
jgi:hypothetical protein